MADRWMHDRYDPDEADEAERDRSGRDRGGRDYGGGQRNRDGRGGYDGERGGTYRNGGSERDYRDAGGYDRGYGGGNDSRGHRNGGSDRDYRNGGGDRGFQGGGSDRSYREDRGYDRGSRDGAGADRGYRNGGSDRGYGGGYSSSGYDGSFSGRGGGRGGSFGGRSGGRGGGRTSTVSSAEARRRLQEVMGRVSSTPKQATQLPNAGLVTRPDLGVIGKQIKVLVNMFRLHINPDLQVWQWDVDLVQGRSGAGPSSSACHEGAEGGPSSGPVAAAGGTVQNRAPERTLCHRIVAKLAQEQGWPAHKWAYDGQKILYTLVEDFMGGGEREHKYSVSVMWSPSSLPGAAQGSSRPLNFKVKLQQTAFLTVGEIVQRYLMSPDASLPRAELSALDVAIKQDVIQELCVQAVAGKAEPSAGSRGGESKRLRSNSGAPVPADRDTAARMAELVGKVMGHGIYWPEEKVPLGPRAEAWHGGSQSISAGQDGLQVAVDATLAAMPVCKDLLQLLQEELGAPNLASLRTRELTLSEITRLNKKFKEMTLKVNFKHRPAHKARTVQGLSSASARKYMFEKDGKPISVADYFEEAYKKLEYPNLPCVELGRREKAKVALPLEVCFSVPEVGQRKLGVAESQVMIKAAAMPAPERQEKIINLVLRKLRTGQGPTAKNFGLAMDIPRTRNNNAQLTEVQGRILPVPQLEYGQDKCVDPGTRGSWQLIGVPFLRPAELYSAAMLCYFRVRDDNLRSLLQELQGALEQKACPLPRDFVSKMLAATVTMKAGQPHHTGLEQAMDAGQRAFGKLPQIVFCLIEREDAGLYQGLKRAADCRVGVLTQVLVAQNLGVLRNLDQRSLNNLGKKMEGVALKVNTKLGGDNVKMVGNITDWIPPLKSMKEPPRVMLLGADVSHATNLPPESVLEEVQKAAAERGDIMPSVGAVVASVDADFSRYVTRIFRNPPLTESIVDMGNIVTELLKAYQEANGGQLPNVIIMFRDGVSEGQFEKVLQDEMAGITKGCSNISSRYKPRITFASVQKRHNTRFFPSPNDRNSMDNPTKPDTANVPPGLVVDTSICHPHGFDFYLNAHAGIQGTNKPAKYSVLADQNGLSADSLQLLSYWLCHLYSRCARSVSYCPPAYYAHHAAFRGRAWLRKVSGTGSDLDASSVTSDSSVPGTWVFDNVHPRLLNEMYFI